MEGKGEIRRVQIIYFLSRMGRIEQPHLIRVHHLNRNGVHLRDVKRWLSELRGKDMPDSFAWSYKRRYKTGYVWQDLLDDDLITPISDNEFVLKGSEISAISFDPCLQGEKKVSIKKTETPSSTIGETTTVENPYLKSEILTNKETQIDEDSGPLDSETSTASYESIRTNSAFIPDQVEEDKSNITTTTTTTEIEELGDDQIENPLEKLKKNEEDEVLEKKKSSSSSSSLSSTSTSSSSSSSSSFNKGKSYSSGAANVLRCLLNCRAVDTDDSSMMMINKSNSSEICRLESSTLGGSDRISCGPWNPQHKTNGRRSYSGEKGSNQSSEFGGQKKVSAAFKPVAEPHCSQCGKGFKPEKLHSHMKSCRGLKNLGKSRSAAATADFGPGAAADQKSSSQTY